MASYRFLVQQLSGFFDGCEFLHVPRTDNEAANTLAKIGSSRQSIPSGVFLEHLHKPSVKPSLDPESIFVPDDPAAPPPGPGTAEPGPGAAEPGLGSAEPNPGTTEPGPGATQPGSGADALDPVAVVLDPAVVVPDPGAAASGSGAAAQELAMVAVFAVATVPSWALPISEFMETGVLPMDETEARQVQHRASAYSTINNELIKRGPTDIFQCCIEQEKGIEILLDIHQDAESLVLKCEGYQRFSKRSHQPASAL
ncbi:uncharacterized protein [Aegilops tauschii subsp. strangulata]|uniref:uncharacterized protein n=1 Tax=Aegilops tauschii subsp. strangulata TaxID=200361 RepID=UPI00098A0C5E|nr:uncharacterized protein LOC109776145 [Aegilops tauschii subsp. strangulata]